MNPTFVLSAAHCFCGNDLCEGDDNDGDGGGGRSRAIKDVKVRQFT